MKTAVEWLVENYLDLSDEYNTLSLEEIVKQANKMFEEQINNAHYEGSENYRRQYYKLTFKPE